MPFGLRQNCIEKGLARILLYVGGNLVVGKTDFERVEAKFKAMGYDRVFPSQVELDAVAALLKQDVTATRGSAG